MNERSVLTSVIVAATLGLSFGGVAAESGWTRKTAMPTARFGFSVGVVKDKIYAIGGTQEWYPGAGLGVVEEYDPKPKVSLLRTGGTLAVYWNGILESIEAVSGSNWQMLHPSAWSYSIYPVRPWKVSRARDL